MLQQLAWLVEADPFVLLQLRGLPRDELMARLHSRTVEPDEDVDLDAAVEAALYAARVLDDLSDRDEPAPPAPSG